MAQSCAKPLVSPICGRLFATAVTRQSAERAATGFERARAPKAGLETKLRARRAGLFTCARKAANDRLPLLKLRWNWAVLPKKKGARASARRLKKKMRCNDGGAGFVGP